MLNENEVLERAFRALDDLIGRPEIQANPPALLPMGTHAVMTTAMSRDADVPPDHLESSAAAPSLKGQAVELWCDHAGGRVFIVADEQDAQDAIRRFGAQRGGIWTPAEIELVASIQEQAIRDEVAAFKRSMDGCLSTDSVGPGVSPDEWRAQALNRLFQEQGVTGKPGRITAATVRHGERKTRGGER